MTHCRQVTSISRRKCIEFTNRSQELNKADNPGGFYDLSNVCSLEAGVVSSSAQNSRRGSGHVEFDPTNTVKLPSLGKGPQQTS